MCWMTKKPLYRRVRLTRRVLVWAAVAMAQACAVSDPGDAVSTSGADELTKQLRSGTSEGALMIFNSRRPDDRFVAYKVDPKKLIISRRTALALTKAADNPESIRKQLQQQADEILLQSMKSSPQNSRQPTAAPPTFSVDWSEVAFIDEQPNGSYQRLVLSTVKTANKLVAKSLDEYWRQMEEVTLTERSPDLDSRSRLHVVYPSYHWSDGWQGLFRYATAMEQLSENGSVPVELSECKDELTKQLRGDPSHWIWTQERPSTACRMARVVIGVVCELFVENSDVVLSGLKFPGERLGAGLYEVDSKEALRLVGLADYQIDGSDRGPISAFIPVSKGIFP